MGRITDLVRADEGDLAIGLAAGGAAVAGSYGAAGATPAFVVAPVARAVTVLMPGPVVTWAIRTLGDAAQPLTLLLALVLTVAGFALLAHLGWQLGRWAGTPVAAPVLVGAGQFGAALALTGAEGGAAGVVAGLVAGLAGGLVVALAVPEPAVAPVSVARRRVLRAGAGAAAAVSAGTVAGLYRSGPLPSGLSTGSTSGSGGGGGGDGGTASLIDDDLAPEVRTLLRDAEERTLAMEGTDGLVTPAEGFYEVDINNIDPDLAAEEWSLRLAGAVDREREFDFADLTAMAAEHRFVTLRCVGEQLNGRKMDTALWTGVPLTALFDGADLPEECCVRLRAADDYYQAFPLAALEDALLAYRMNGRPLPRGHGRPVRVLVPGHWGEINVKWLTEIEVRAEPAEGYWEKRGWHGTGPVNTVAKLHAVNRLEDGRIEVGGHAYAGTRGIDRVEVSTDGGDAWTAARLSEQLPGRVPAGEEDVEPAGEATDAARQWRHVYEASEPHEVVVRAVDGNGALQERERSDAFPSGATGWVSRPVDPTRDRLA